MLECVSVCACIRESERGNCPKFSEVIRKYIHPTRKVERERESVCVDQLKLA